MLKFDQSLQISDISGVPWIENIPEHWDLKKLKYVASIRFSNVDKNTSESEHPVLLCNYVDVYKNSKITSNIDFMQASARLEEIRKFHVQVGDVLVTKDSERPDDIAIAAFVAENITNLLCGYHLALIRPDSNILNGCFLNYLFSSKLFRFQYERMANGVTRFGLSQNAFKDSIIPLPSLEEQNKIVSFLDQQTAKLDQLIEKKKRLIDLLQEKRQALITQAVTKGLDPNVPMKDSGIEWLGEVPAHWTVSRLKPFIILNPSKQEISKFSLDTEVTFVPMEAVNESGIVDYSRIKIISECMAGYTYFRDGDVLLAKITPCFENGKAALVDGLNNGIGFGSTEFHVLRANSNIDSHYLAYIVQSDPFRKLGEASMIGAAGQKRVPESFILNFKQAFPPIDEQVEIANFLDREISNIDKIINKLNQQITIIQEYRQALITAAVTGQIDVREKLAVSADPTPAGKEERPCHPYIPNGRWRTPSRRTLSNMEAMRKAIRPNTTGNWRCSRRR